MTADTHPTVLPLADGRASGPGRRSRPLRSLTLAEAKLARREPSTLIGGVALPVLLLVIFGSVPSLNQPQAALGGASVEAVYQPIIIAMSLAVFAFVAVPIPLAGYREQGVFRRMATTPVPPSRVLAAHLFVDFTFALGSLLVVLAVGRVWFHTALPHQVPGFVLSYLLAVACLFAIGLWIGAVARTAKVGQAIGGALFYPMNFLGGLWFPRQEMPPVLRTISDCSPLGAAVQALQDTIDGTFPPARFLLVLAGYAALFGYLAVRQFAWE
jgi:ABC-2 type transport system permease protein